MQEKVGEEGGQDLRGEGSQATGLRACSSPEGEEKTDNARGQGQTKHSEKPIRRTEGTSSKARPRVQPHEATLAAEEEGREGGDG